MQPEGALLAVSEIDAILADVGDTVQHIRVAQRVELAHLARLATLSPQALSRIERGTRHDLGLRSLYAVSSVLGVRLSDVLSYSERYVMEGNSPWPLDGTNSALVEAIFSTAPQRGSLYRRE